MRYPRCRCEDLGLLHPDMQVDALRIIGSGCTDSRFTNHPLGVCTRLDAIRRHFKTWERMPKKY